MIEFNRILLQLDRAVTCANSPYPQEKATAIILFDNLIEIQLYKRAENTFMLDRTAWYNGNRKFNKNIRTETASKDGKYDKLLKFSKNNKIICEKDFETLKYVHRIRNGVYHRGELEELKLDLAIMTYYGFLSKTLKSWGNVSMLYSLPGSFPGDEEIDFGQGLHTGDILSFEHKKYFNDSLDSIFARLNIKGKLSEQITHIISKQIKRIRWAIDFITKESKSINFYDVLGRFWYLNADFFEFHQRKRKPKNIDSILILYAFLREQRDYLDDIADLKERQKEGRKQLKLFRQKHKGKYPHWMNLENIEKRIQTFSGKDERTLILNLQEIEGRLSLLYLDTDEAASDLDGHIQFLNDLARGK